jgi:hypothetical protein
MTFKACRTHYLCWFTLTFVTLAAFIAPSSGFAQARYAPRYEEPQWVTFHLSQVDAGAYSEGTFDQTRFNNSDQTVTHEHLFVGPSIGLSGNGSIYHPNLLTYYLDGEGAFGYSRDSFGSTAAPSSARQGFDALGHFSFTADLLSGKPYHASAFANYDHTFRDNDFFTRTTVDSWRYGGRASWQIDRAWSVFADYVHRDEDSTSPFPVTQTVLVTNVIGGTNVITSRTNHFTSDQITSTHDDTVTFGARNERTSGGSSLTYTFDRYTRADAGAIGQGNDHSLTLGDGERFGAQEKYKLNSSASFLHRDALFESSDELIADENFSAEHRPNLSSFYDFNYDQFHTDEFDSQTYNGQASLRHQLYDSLTSTLIFRGSDFSTSDPNNSTDTLRYGGGFGEFYTKRLTDEHRVRISNSLFIDHTDQAVETSALISIRNERHNFSEGGAPAGSFFLGLLNVVASGIVITDENDTQPPFLENFDYRVVVNGSRTLIERLPGSRIGAAQIVLVDYDAAPTPSGSYNTLSEFFELRFELWKNLLGIYGRINLSLNDAPIELRVQDVHAYTVGTDLNWRWLRAGAEYQIYDSTESNYRSTRLFQSFLFRPDEASTLGLDFSETWIDYLDANRSEEQYQFITRYHRALSRHLALDADAGVSVRRGNGVDQTLATVRPSLKYVIGKTTIDAGFDYEYELFLNSEQRQKEMFFLRLKRYF